MDKKRPQKESLKAILTALIPYRNLAELFFTIIKETEDEELEKEILSIITKWVKSINSQQERTKIKKKIKEIQNKSEYENEKDKKEADKILNDFINNIND